MRQVGERILPGASIDEVIEHLDADRHRAIEGVDEFRRWNQELIDQTIAELDGTHFDIAPPLQRCEAMIAPPGGAAAMYYTGPTEDFSRPGPHLVPDDGRDPLPAVEGSEHLLPRGAFPAITCRSRRWCTSPTSCRASSALFGFVSGSRRRLGAVRRAADGRARLPRRPRVTSSACSRAQAMRAVRVVVDIGMHLELAIIDGEPHHRARRGRPSSRCRS